MNRARIGFYVFCCCIFLTCLTAVGEVTLPNIIGSNMVLQQKTKAAIWGWADPGEKISVKADWRWFPSSTKADASGKWIVHIPTPKAGGSYTITINAGNTITLENVLIGEVWVCSGQSNMEMPMVPTPEGYLGILNYEQEVAAADYPEIRLFDISHEFSTTPKDDSESSWTICKPKTAKLFATTGYFFGRKLHKDLNVPVGLIGSNWGGTPAESWTSPDFVKTIPAFAEKVELMQDEKKMAQAQADYKAALTKWQFEFEAADAGIKGQWSKPETDDSAWETMNLPVNWEKDKLGESMDGVVWFRKSIDIPEKWLDKNLMLELGPIDDDDITFVNGVEVGRLNNWYTPRKYTVPASILRQGVNVIAVRVYDSVGLGGFGGKAEQMKLHPVDEPGTQAIPLSGPWSYKVGFDHKDVARRPVSPVKIGAWTPGTLYNGMIAPIIPYAIRGAVWYQGESNVSRPGQYQKLFPLMIQSWRKEWGQGDFPFYYVQIAPWNYGNATNSAFLREAQFLSLATPNTGMVVTMDIGNIKDVHPKNKQEVGRRLALWALAKTYHKTDTVYSGPLYKSMKIEDGEIRLFFDYVDGGLVAKDGPLTDFTIASKDRKFVAAEAFIEGKTVVVSCADVKEPVAVRFAFTNTSEPNLFNKAGLPASSFRTDKW